MSANDRPYRIAELFCGCGGLSHGFALSGRFSVELGSDISEVFCQTFQKNHYTEEGKPPIVLEGNIEKLAIKDLPLAFRDLGYLANGRLDVLAGGPPCEGFSQNKRSEAIDPETGETSYGGYKSNLNDPRNFLVRRFLKVVEDLLPKIVVIENVPQILTHDSGRFGAQVTARLRGLGYLVKPEVLFAPDYGVPQMRRRAILLAVREDVVKRVGWVPEFPPRPTHYPANASAPPITGLNAAVTVKDAIFDLPPSAEVEEGGKPASGYPASETICEYAATWFSCCEAPIYQCARISNPG